MSIEEWIDRLSEDSVSLSEEEQKELRDMLIKLKGLREFKKKVLISSINDLINDLERDLGGRHV